jgi:hypothetical protein
MLLVGSLLKKKKKKRRKKEKKKKEEKVAWEKMKLSESIKARVRVSTF